MKTDTIQLVAALAVIALAAYGYYLVSGLTQDDMKNLAPSLRKFNAWAAGLP